MLRVTCGAFLTNCSGMDTSRNLPRKASRAASVLHLWGEEKGQHSSRDTQSLWAARALEMTAWALSAHVSDLLLPPRVSAEQREPELSDGGGMAASRSPCLTLNTDDQRYIWINICLKKKENQFSSSFCIFSLMSTLPPLHQPVLVIHASILIVRLIYRLWILTPIKMMSIKHGWGHTCLYWFPLFHDTDLLLNYYGL